MGFNKRYIDKDRIISSFKGNGSQGVVDLYNADAIILEGRCPVCHYIDKVMSKTETTEKKTLHHLNINLITYKKDLIELYMSQLLEGLYTSKI